MFQLTGKVGLDASGFYRALTGMKAAAAPLGNQIAKQLGSRFMSFFGAGAFVNQFRKTLAGAFEIRKEAGKLGIDTTTFQTLSKLADETGADMSKMVEQLHGDEGFAQAIRDANVELLETGKIIRDDTIKNLAELQDKFNALSGRIAPGAASLADVGISAYDWIAKEVFEEGVGAAQKLYGILTGKKEHEAAGNEMLGLTPSTDPTDAGATGAYEKAKGAIARGAKAGVVEGFKETDFKRNEQKHYGGLPISSDTSIGRHFGKGAGMTPAENQLRLLNRTMADINRKIGNW